MKTIIQTLSALFFITSLVAAEPGETKAALDSSTEDFNAANTRLTQWLDAGISEDPSISEGLQKIRTARESVLEKDAVWRAATAGVGELEKLNAERTAATEAFNNLRESGAAPDSEEYKGAQATVSDLGQKIYYAREKLKPNGHAEATEHLNQARQQLKSKVLTYSGDDAEVLELAASYHAAEKKLAAARKADDAANGLVSPMDYLASQTPPVFAQKHTLPPLTRFGWAMPFDYVKVFADHWGYALMIEGYMRETQLNQLGDPLSDTARLVETYQANPEKYKVSALTNRFDPTDPPQETWTRDESGNLLSGQAVSLDGTQWTAGVSALISPEAPDEYFAQAGRGRAEPLAEINKHVPISLVLNGGEWGLGVWGFAGQAWVKDPKVTAAIKKFEEETGGNRQDYLDDRVANSKKVLAAEVRKGLPQLEMYVYYTSGGNSHRGRNPGWRDWAVTYKASRGLNELPSNEYYANHWNSGFDGKEDVLTGALNSRGQELAFGDTNSYDWFWAASETTEPIQYQGFLKCMYLLGTLGGNAGTYWTPDWTASFPPDEPPSWVWQQMALGRVHAFFSHYEDYIRNGDLVDDGKFRNYFSTDQPAYELLPKELRDSRALKTEIGSDKLVAVLQPGRPFRVVARKHRDKDEWLVAAWTAEVGDGPGVYSATVKLPDAGELVLEARKGGSLYLVTLQDGEPVVKQLDPVEADPTAAFRK